MKAKGFEQSQSSRTMSMVIFAAFVGILGDLGTILFRKLVAFIHNAFFLGQFSLSYNENLHTSASVWGYGVILIPMIGGLIVIWLIEKFANGQRGLSVPEIMYALFYRDGKIYPIIALAKTLASAITIGTGGSVGREGPVFQIGATLSSVVSDFTQLSVTQRKVLISAGVAACTAAIFHAPLSGIIFAVEMLTPISLFGLLLIIIATLSSTISEYILIGLNPIFSIHHINQIHFNFTLHHLFLFILFGITAGILSAFFIRSTYWFEDLFNRYIKNVYLHHMAGMLLVGFSIYLLFSLFGHYYIEGVGFATIQDCLHNQILNPWLLLLLIIAKLLATCLTLGSGASGGIFSPSLFIGATLGSLFGNLINTLFPALGADPILFTLIGMAAILGSTTGALLTSVILIEELIRNFDSMLPILVTVLITYIVRRCLCRENIYTLKLHRRGVDLHKRFYC